MNSYPRVKNLYLFALVVILSVVFLSISYFRMLDSLELIALDLRYGLRPAPPTNRDIVLIEISEDSLKALGRWPFPRDYHASLIDVLSEAGARMVIFDILFSEGTAWDETLAEAAREFKKAYFPFAFRLDAGKPAWSAGRFAFAKALAGRQRGILKAHSIDAPLLENLNEASAGAGFINKLVDIDGKVRRVPLLVDFEGKLYPHLSLKAACDYMNISLEGLGFDGKGHVRVGEELVIPTDSHGGVLLNFVGPWVGSFAHYSYLDIVAAHYESEQGRTPRIDLDELEGKICFVGLTATGTHELGPVPIEKSYPMMGVHANLFNMITKGIYLRRLKAWQNLIILIVFSVLFFLLILRARPLGGLLIAAGSIPLIFILSIFAFALAGIWIDVVSPAIAFMAVYLGVALNRSIVEIKKRLQMEKELAVAKSIQQSFLPQGISGMEGLDVASIMITAKEVGGDLYDFIRLDDDKLGVMIGDVSGKGVPASLIMAQTISLFRVFARSLKGPAEVLNRLNRELCGVLQGGFVTAMYLVVDTKGRLLEASCAGHSPMVFYNSQDDETSEILPVSGPPLGIMDCLEYENFQKTVSRKDKVLLYTDGVSEARNRKGEEFGIQRLKDLLRRNKTTSGQRALDNVKKEILSFFKGLPQHDDITAILLDF